MKTTTCPICNFHSAEEREFSEMTQHLGRDVRVDGLRHFVCPECETVFSSEEQSRHNLVVTQVAYGEEPKFVLPHSIKEWRERIGLTQRQLARICGGGLNAFSKYENGEVTQSEAMDNLIWAAMRYPGVIAALAGRRGIALPERLTSTLGPTHQWSITIDSIRDERRSNWNVNSSFGNSSLKRRGMTYSETRAANDEIQFGLQAA